MKLGYIRATRDGRMTLGVTLGTEVRRFSISSSLAVSLGLRRGMQLGDSEMEEIERDDEEHRAMKKALSLLSYADNSLRQLVIKLRRAGFSRQVSLQTAEKCVRLGYINEERQLTRLILNEANSLLHGRSYIIKKMVSRGYSSSLVDALIDGLVKEGEIDFSKNLSALCERCGEQGAEGRSRLAFKYGYRSYEID